MLIGGTQNDTLIGGAGADVLNGGAGRDALRGQTGNDVLLVAGRDTASGGSGADIFSIGDSTRRVEILDFEAGVDLLVFNADNLTFEDIEISALGNNSTRLMVDDHEVILRGVQASQIERSNFLMNSLEQGIVWDAIDAFSDNWAYA